MDNRFELDDIYSVRKNFHSHDTLDDLMLCLVLYSEVNIYR